MNRLADQTSPYLRQHADNPVDWYPWGQDAFAAARERDRPIMLSVGYSACHWCHVMAHESFEDIETAEVMNDLFVNVKVDREERPDVDALYMDAVQSMTGHGGWPMTVFLTPGGEPFFGGTYFPKHGRAGLPSFVELCRAVDQAWQSRRGELQEQAGRMAEALRQSTLGAEGGALPGAGLLGEAAAALRMQFDRDWGGFGRAPKFPQTMSHELLLRVHDRTGEAGLMDMVTTSLDAMASGGMYDHLGGGFSRYSVDAFWMVPHFEKMLYDQALLARVYLHAWQLTGEDRYRQVLEETIAYVQRDLAAPGGGCYSAEDADSEGEEGRFYVWRPEEIRTACGDDGDAADAAIEWYGVTAAGNFEGANILHRPVRGDLLRPPAVERARRAMFAAREERIRPGLDDKVLTEWNGLFLATLAEAAAATGNLSWRAAAVELAEFLLAELRTAGGRWQRSWQPGAGARHLAFAADHAAVIDGFTRLGECTGEARWIDEARSVADALLELFWDDERGGVFTTGHDAEALIARQKEVLDNATPSANGAAALSLARLATLSGVERYRESAESIVRLLAIPASSHPTAFTHLLGALDHLVGPVTEVAVVGELGELVAAVQRRFRPRSVLAWGEPFPSPLWEGRRDGHAYVCEGYACQRPVTTLEALETLLDTV